MLVYKLAGSARGAFPNDVELLEAGNDWLPTAGALATEIWTVDPSVFPAERGYERLSSRHSNPRTRTAPGRPPASSDRGSTGYVPNCRKPEAQTRLPAVQHLLCDLVKTLDVHRGRYELDLQRS